MTDKHNLLHEYLNFIECYFWLTKYVSMLTLLVLTSTKKSACTEEQMGEINDSRWAWRDLGDTRKSWKDCNDTRSAWRNLKWYQIHNVNSLNTSCKLCSVHFMADWLKQSFINTWAMKWDKAGECWRTHLCQKDLCKLCFRGFKDLYMCLYYHVIMCKDNDLLTHITILFTHRRHSIKTWSVVYIRAVTSPRTA